MSALRRLLLALPLLLLATAWAPPQQQGEIAVLGQVTNGTPGETVPADLAVTLSVFTGMEAGETYSTTLAADGSFRFDLPAPEGEANLLAQVLYQGVTYVSEFGALEPGQTEVALPVSVYETTEDPSTVLVTQLHVFLVVAGGQLQVSEYLLLSNTGERTYVGTLDPATGERTTLTFALPDGVESLSFDGPGLGTRFVEQEGGFADTWPIPPGTATTEIFTVYELPYREGLLLERAFDVPVASVVLVLPDVGVSLEGEALTPEGAIDTQMGLALSYTAGPLAAGQPLAFTFAGQPQAVMPSAPGSDSPPTDTAPVRNALQEVGIGLVALSVAGVAVYLMWRGPTPGAPPAQVRPLLEDIAALDADFEAGRMAEKTYRQKRRALKQQIRTLLDAGPGGRDDA